MIFEKPATIELEAFIFDQTTPYPYSFLTVSVNLKMT